eukprot:2635159-Amphidinium_carterae.1
MWRPCCLPLHNSRRRPRAASRNELGLRRAMPHPHPQQRPPRSQSTKSQSTNPCLVVSTIGAVNKVPHNDA